MQRQDQRGMFLYIHDAWKLNLKLHKNQRIESTDSGTLITCRVAFQDFPNAHVVIHVVRDNTVWEF